MKIKTCEKHLAAGPPPRTTPLPQTL